MSTRRRLRPLPPRRRRSRAKPSREPLVWIVAAILLAALGLFLALDARNQGRADRERALEGVDRALDDYQRVRRERLGK